MESIKELKGIVEKGIKRRPFSAMWFIEPVQVYVTKLLLLMGMNRIQVSLLWLFLGLVTAGLFLTGDLRWGFVAILLHYLQTILDGCDGQVARYNKRRLTEEQDALLWSYGLYLDFFQHILIDSLTMAMFAIGLYRITGHFGVLIAGAVLVYLRMYKRTDSAFVLKTARSLEKKKEVFNRISLKDPTRLNGSLPVRLIDKFSHWTRNGKRLFLLILIAHLLDAFLPELHTSWGLLNYRILLIYLVAAGGIVGVIKDLVVALVYGELVRQMKQYW